MGTHGNKVYRHNGYYYVYFNRYDSYPSFFGLKLLHEIPRNVSKEEFEEWLRKTREYVYAQRDSQVLNDPDDSSNYVSDEQPKNRLFIQWVYEIDLDNLVFHVDSQPLFRLDNMPPDDVFLEAISFDHFGHRALFECTPVQFRYDWRAPPPTPSLESLVAYNSSLIRSSTSSVHDLLDRPLVLSSIERVRTTSIELLVARRMTEYDVGHDARILENTPDRDHIPQSMLELALTLVKLAVGPPIYSLDLWSRDQNKINWDFVWIRKDACLRITTHLDDEDNLRASIGDLVHHINTTQDKMGTIYGVACSIFHCAIVRVDKDPQGTSFAHTPALQLLPSFYARKMSTPGIEALSRLGCQTSGVEFLDIIHNKYGSQNRRHTFTTGTNRKSLVMRGSAVEKVPVEVWTRIGDFFSSSSDLVNLASISPEALSAAADLTRYPWVEVPRSGYPLREFRLLDVVSSASPIPETTRETKHSAIQEYYHELGRAKFTAVVHGHRVAVNLVQEYGDTRHVVHQSMSLEIETYNI